MENILVTISFYGLALLAILSALGVVFLNNIVRAATTLMVTFLSIAGLYILLNADFVAMAQILVYSVGIAIIILFALMLVKQNTENKSNILTLKNALAFITCSLLYLIMLIAILTTKFNIIEPSKYVYETIKNEGTTALIGTQIFSGYVLPFEIISILLFVALFGAVVLAKKIKPENEDVK